jgi:hypothetical protein
VLLGAGAVAVLALALAAVLAVMAGGRAAAPTSAAQVSVELGGYAPVVDACLNGPADGRQSECLLGVVDTATAAGQYGAALAALREGVERTYDMVGRCHNATHEVGRAIVRGGMPLLEAYQVPFPDCRFGFYHGALAQYVEPMSIEELSAAMPTLCTPFGDVQSDAVQECVHVTGHFVVDRIGTDLGASLAACGVYADERLVARCTDGVFMQAVDLSRPGVHDPDSDAGRRISATWGVSPSEQEQAAVGACAALEGGVQYVCYTAVSQTLAVLWDGRYQDVHQVCAALPREGVQPCFEGIAASAFTLASWDREAVAAACHASDDPGTRFCIGSMAFTLGLQDSSERSASTCELAREHELADCRESLERGISVAAGLGGRASS